MQSKKGFSLSWQVIVVILIVLSFLVWAAFFYSSIGDSIVNIFSAD